MKETYQTKLQSTALLKSLFQANYKINNYKFENNWSLSFCIALPLSFQMDPETEWCQKSIILRVVA